MTEETLKQDNPALDYDHRIELSDLARQLREVATKTGMSSQKISQSLKVHKTMEGPFTLLNDLDNDIDEATSILIGVYRQWGAMIEHFKSWLRPPRTVTEVKMMPDAHAEEMKICINEIVNIKKRILCEEEGVSNSDLNRAWEALFGLNDKLQDPQLEDLAVMQQRQREKAPVVKDTEFKRYQMRRGLARPTWLPEGSDLGVYARELPGILRACRAFQALFASKAMTKKGLTFVCPECGALPGESCVQNKEHSNRPSRVMKGLHFKRKTLVDAPLEKAPPHLEPWQDNGRVAFKWITPYHVTATQMALSLWDGEEQLTYQAVSSLARKLFPDDTGVVAYEGEDGDTHSRAYSLREWCGVRDRLIAHRKIGKLKYMPPPELIRPIPESEIEDLQSWAEKTVPNDQVNEEREVAPVKASDTCALPPQQRPAPQ